MKLIKEEAEEKLRNQCFIAGLNDTDTEIVIDFYVHKLQQKEIADKRGYAVQTIRNKISRFNKKSEGV